MSAEMEVEGEGSEAVSESGVEILELASVIGFEGKDQVGLC